MRSFFGLNDEYIENVYEQIFNLKYHGGWSFFESYNLPVSVRVWFLRRLVEQKKDETDQANNAVSSGGRGKTYKP